MRSITPFAAGVITIALCGCATLTANKQHFPHHDARFITREDIKRTGATDAWDALKGVGNFMSMKEGRGQDMRTSQRGRSSILLSDEMMLVVDNVVLNNLSDLHSIPAQSIDWMQILSGKDGTVIYGTPGANGVIVIKTGIADEDK